MAVYDISGNRIDQGGGAQAYNWTGKRIVFEGDSITANSSSSLRRSA